MDMLRTDRTYVSRENAVKALERACAKLGADFARVRYLIATNEAGRFAPVVTGGWDNVAFVHNGVTVV